MATITDMGIPSDRGVNGILQPFHKHRWEVQFFLPGRPEGLTAMAITADRPKLEFEEIQLDRYNSRAWIFGKHTFQPINIVFEPDIASSVHDTIVDQLERQQHLIEQGSFPFMGQADAGEDYKFGIRLRMLNGSHTNSDGLDGLELERWELEGCGLQNNDFGDLDYAASETLKTTLTIRYDHARLVRFASNKKATGGQIT